MTFNPMAHVGMEVPLDPAIIAQMAKHRHYGFSWSGPEPDCPCERAGCGLVVSVATDCTIHSVTLIGAAKQVHWARECPAP